MNPRVSDIIELINNIAPFRYAEEWDNAGLQVGDPSGLASRIMISLDPCQAALQEAVAAGCQLLVTHHPLIFKPIRSINLREQPGMILESALRNNLSIVSMHTNLDIAHGGINDLLASKLGVSSAEPLDINGTDELVKLAVFVPKGHEEQVMEVLFRFSGHLGNYSDCSFQSGGVGTFRPLAGAEPFIGSIGQREYADETRLEVLLRGDDVPAACKALVEAHPYEEPAFDLYPLLNRGAPRGLGRIGKISRPMSLERLACRFKKELSLSGVKFVGDGARLIERIALCAGSGASLLHQACNLGADVLVTGDIKYHDAREAETLGIGLLDIGHFASEILMVKGVCQRLEEEVRKKGFDADIMACESERDPFQYR